MYRHHIFHVFYDVYSHILDNVNKDALVIWRGDKLIDWNYISCLDDNILTWYVSWFLLIKN